MIIELDKSKAICKIGSKILWKPLIFCEYLSKQNKEIVSGNQYPAQDYLWNTTRERQSSITAFVFNFGFPTLVRSLKMLMSTVF